MKIKKLNIYQWLAVVVVGIILVACATVPLTGRKQLTFMNDTELAKMSLVAYNQVIDSVKLSANPQDVQMIKSCGERISSAVEQYLAQIDQQHLVAGYEWEFNLIEENTPNAWCMPGGYVAFYTGILPLCKDENGVAVVMGHEIAHAIARHGNERMSQGMLAQLGGVALSVALVNKPQMTQQLAMQAFGIGSTLGILAYSRTHESESDHLGLIFMSIAGYDPLGAPQFWERMAEKSKNVQKPPEFLSTHPSDQKRIARLNALMPEAIKFYNQYQGKASK